MLIYALAFVLDRISESEHMIRSSSPEDGSMKNEMDKIENGDCPEGDNSSKTEEKDTTDIFASGDALFHDEYRRYNSSYRTRSKNVLCYTFHSLFCYSSRVFLHV